MEGGTKERTVHCVDKEEGEDGTDLWWTPVVVFVYKHGVKDMSDVSGNLEKSNI